jgi:hypothetical protein
MLYPRTPEFDSAADAFAAGWVLLLREPHPLLGEDGSSKVTASVNPLETRMVHRVRVDGATRNAIRLDGVFGVTDSIFRLLLVATYSCTADERNAAKIDAFDECIESFNHEVADAYAMLDLVVDHQIALQSEMDYDRFFGGEILECSFPDENCEGTCGNCQSMAWEYAKWQEQSNTICTECIKELTGP